MAPKKKSNAQACSHWSQRLVACAVVSLGTWSVFPNTIQAQQSPLISVQALNKIKNDPNLVLLQVGPKDDYDAGHIEGARLIAQQDIAAKGTETKLVLELPSEANLRDILQNLGIGDKSKVVVVYGRDWTSPSTRVMFTLQAAGLGAQSQLLDGGSAAWKREGLPLTKAAPAPAKPGKLTLAAHRELVVDYTWMQAHTNSSTVRLIDGRAPVFFEGAGMKHEGQPNEPAGHIAGAKNIPFNTLVDDAGLMLPTDSLRKIFSNAGVQAKDTVTAYCHIGQQGTVVLFAARLLGNPIRLYDGSMDDWNARKLPLVNDRKNH